VAHGAERRRTGRRRSIPSFRSRNDMGLGPGRREQAHEFKQGVLAGGQVTTETRSSSGWSAVQGVTPASSYGGHRVRERPQAALAASAPPREPPEYPHIEGGAATEGINGGGGLGFGDRRGRGVARLSGERNRVGGGSSFIGCGDRPRFVGPRPGAQGCGRRGAVRPGCGSGVA
jgi:hypothetical protein